MATKTITLNYKGLSLSLNPREFVASVTSPSLIASVSEAPAITTSVQNGATASVSLPDLIAQLATLPLLTASAQGETRIVFDGYSVSPENSYTHDFWTELADQTGLTEELLMWFVLERLLEDATAITEGLSLATGKNISDETTVSEILAWASAFNRELNENTALADSTAFSVDKVLPLEMTGIAEELLLSFLLAVNLQDATVLAETLALLVDKGISEETTLAEVLTFVVTYVRELAETVNTSETLAFAVSQVVPTDITAITESLIIAFLLERELNDNTAITDNLIFAVDKYLNDATILSETFDFNWTFGREPNDVTAITQVLSLDTSIVHSDATAVIDLSEFTVGQTVQDASALLDSGVIVIQDYVDGDYFIDDYVGTKYTI